MKITQTLDLRNNLPTIRDQGQKPYCLAFASSDLNSFHHNIIEPFSAEYLADLAHKIEGNINPYGLKVSSIIKALNETGQPKESECPLLNIFDSSHKSSQTLYKVNTEDSSEIINSIDKNIDLNQIVIACIKMPRSFLAIMPPFILDKELGCAGNHAILIVGKGKSECGTDYYLIRNSWGDGWALNGYCWVSKYFLESRTISIIRVCE